MSRRFQIGERLGEYRITGFIGMGGMGEVYEAVHEKLSRGAAVKVLGGSACADPSFRTRFLNEARLQGSLHHPNVASLYDFRELGSELLIFMELVDGESLDALIDRQFFSLEESLVVFKSIVGAIAYVHSHGIIHRDIKAENVKLSSIGAPKLLDFGIARDPKTQNLTQVGGVIGTPNYLAPEQLEGQGASERTDIWSLGVLLYKMVTGVFPFASDVFENLIFKITQGRFENPETLNKAIPADVSAVIRKCLAKDEGARYQSADALLVDIERILNERYSSESTIGRRSASDSSVFLKVAAAVGSAVFIILLLFTGFWFMGESSPAVVRNDNNNGSITSPGRPSPTEKPRQNDSGQVQFAAPNGPTTNAKTMITIDTIGGSAEVWRDGRKIGDTPLQVETTDKELINFKLRRNGFSDSDERIEVTPGKRVYTFSLNPK